MNKLGYTKWEGEGEPINCHGKKVGERGDTGVHCHGGVYRGHSFIARPNGGVLVIVDAKHYHIPAEDSDELRFDRVEQAIEYVDDLKPKTQEEIDADPIPF